MTQNWRGVLIRHLLLVVAAGSLLGLITGQYGWAIAVALGAYLGWSTWQLLRLHKC